MTTIGIIGAGEVGSQIARAAIACGYQVVIANSRGPETLAELIKELGPAAHAASAADAAAARDFPEAVALVTRLYDQFGFGTADHSPLSESWRSRPGQPAWKREHQTRSEPTANLAGARSLILTW
jgi:predicted dinucleotide-binding enzyme